MNHPERYDGLGIPIFTAEEVFRPGESVYIHLSTDFPDYVGILHKHEFIEIVCVISGSAVHETAEGSYTVSQGDVVIVNCGAPHAFHAIASSEDFVAYDLMFTPDFLDNSLVRTGDFNEICSSFLFYSLFPAREAIGPDVHLSGASYGIFRALFQKIYEEYGGRQKGYRELVRAYMIELIIELFRKMENASEGKISARKREAAESALFYLSENFRSHVTLEALASHIYLSKDYLNRIFHEVTGQTVIAYLQKLRIEEACRLLASTERTVNDIAAACGFGDVKAFYTAFKRLMYMTPRQYRARCAAPSSE